MNNMSLGLECLVEALRKNKSVVSLKLRNNNIDGRRFTQELY